MKRSISVIFTIAIFCSFGVPAFAANDSSAEKAYQSSKTAKSEIVMAINEYETASSSTPYTIVLSYIDSDQGLGAIIFVPYTLTINYSNTYELYTSPVSNPPWIFKSHSSMVLASVTGQASFVPEIIIMVNRSVTYYNSTGTAFSTQILIWGPGDTSFAFSDYPAEWTLQSMPSYTAAQATCHVDGSANQALKTTTTSF